MPLIDEKGNIFGKLNIIDALIIVILIAVFAATVNLFNSYDELRSLDDSSSSSSSSAFQIPKLRLLLETQVLENYLKFITKGEKDLSNGVTALVEDVFVKNLENGLRNVQIQLLVENPKLSDNFYYFYYSNNQPIFVGKPLTIKLRFIELNTVIKDVNLVEEQLQLLNESK